MSTPRVRPEDRKRPEARPREEVMVRQGESGDEQRCTTCHEWWPRDRDFCYVDPRCGFAPVCRACKLDADRVRRGSGMRPLPPVPEVFTVLLRSAA